MMQAFREAQEYIDHIPKFVKKIQWRTRRLFTESFRVPVQAAK